MAASYFRSSEPVALKMGCLLKSEGDRLSVFLDFVDKERERVRRAAIARKLGKGSSIASLAFPFDSYL